MRPLNQTIASLSWLCAWCGILGSGCGEPQWTNDRYVPRAPVAEQSVVAALTAWQNGQGPGAVAGVTPAVQVIDSHRKPEQRLESFQILGEVPGEGPRCFAVSLKLANPPEERNAKYVVVGIDPLWVFHEEDYAMLAHWEHPMPSESAKETRK
jgi:hypothetical protein